MTGALAITNNSDVFGTTGRDDGSLTALAINCAGSESSLRSCPTVAGGAPFLCGRNAHVGAVCQGNLSLKIKPEFIHVNVNLLYNVANVCSNV